MALGAFGPWSVQFTLQDNNYKSGFFGIKLPADLTPAEVESQVTAMVTALAGVSDAAITSVSYARVAVEQLAINPPASSEVERKLVIPLGTADKLPGVTSIEIPSPRFSLETAGTDVVVPANGSQLEALVALLTAGLLTPGNGPITHYGADITRVGTMTISHRNRKARR